MNTRKQAAKSMWLQIAVAMLSALATGLAMAETQFAEFQGVAEQLAVHSLAIDCDWAWGALLLLVVVLMLWAYSYRDRGK